MLSGAGVAFLVDHPFLLAAASFALLWSAGALGAFIRRHRRTVRPKEAEDYTLTLGAILTLLGLIIGFSFSMAVERYNQRKNYEEEEANAIGTEYVRLDLLPTEAVRVRALLRDYLDQRIAYYMSRDPEALHRVGVRTAEFQASLWSAVAGPGAAQRDAISALVVSGMNDVLNRQGYTQAAWLNRIPIAAWALLLVIATLCGVLLGFRDHDKHPLLLFILPTALSVSLFLIADIDGPRGGVIRVHPTNLEALAESLRSPAP